MTDQLIPVASTKYRALTLHNVGEPDEWVEVSPIIGWRYSEDEHPVIAITISGMPAAVIELPDASIVDEGMTWPTRSAWLEDERAAHAEGVELTREWVVEHHRDKWDALEWLRTKAAFGATVAEATWAHYGHSQRSGSAKWKSTERRLRGLVRDGLATSSSTDRGQPGAAPARYYAATE